MVLVMTFSSEFVEKRIDQLSSERSEIESQLHIIMSEKVVNPFTVKALKQRSTTVNNQIAQLRSRLLPNIIA